MNEQHNAMRRTHQRILLALVIGVGLSGCGPRAQDPDDPDQRELAEQCELALAHLGRCGAFNTCDPNPEVDRAKACHEDGAACPVAAAGLMECQVRISCGQWGPSLQCDFTEEHCQEEQAAKQEACTMQ